MSTQFNAIIDFIRELYGKEGEVHLHQPSFGDIDKKYLIECLDSTNVASTGTFIGEFEERICEFSGSPHAISIVNGTAALHIALQVLGVKPIDLVLTQALSFIATRNAILYTGAEPVFIDVEMENMGMSPDLLHDWLRQNTIQDGSQIKHRVTNQRVSACIPVHTFGIPCQIREIAEVCHEFGIPIIEDAAEALGSYAGRQHCGSFGNAGILSFNGNKTITTGGGGMILTPDPEIAQRIKHLSTQAKIKHPWEYRHDATGFNYRLPNINAALGCAQMQSLQEKLGSKQYIHDSYAAFFKDRQEEFITAPEGTQWNYWLNAILFDDIRERDAFIRFAHENKVFVRPAWQPLDDPAGGSVKTQEENRLTNTYSIYRRLVNLPSSPM